MQPSFCLLLQTEEKESTNSTRSTRCVCDGSILFNLSIGVQMQKETFQRKTEQTTKQSRNGLLDRTLLTCKSRLFRGVCIDIYERIFAVADVLATKFFTFTQQRSYSCSPSPSTHLFLIWKSGLDSFAASCFQIAVLPISSLILTWKMQIVKHRVSQLVKSPSLKADDTTSKSTSWSVPGWIRGRR